jgi:hypothetical protein
MTALAFTSAAPPVPEEPSWTPTPDDVHALRYGYNLDDLQRFARIATWRVVGRIEYQTRYEVAWSAIAEALYSAVQAPEPGELIVAGYAAISAHLGDEMHHTGRDRKHVGQEMPRFSAYWRGLSPHAPSPEQRIVDATALRQIWPHLPGRQREALLALAAHDDYLAAAAALGVTPGAFRALVSQARRTFLRLWHEGETPSRVWGTDRRVGSRASVAEPTSRRRTATRAVVRRKGRPTRELVHGEASTYDRYGCRCKLCTAAKTEKTKQARRAKGVPAQRRVTVSQLADIRRRQAAGETLTAIGADIGFDGSYLSRLVRGLRQPAPDPEVSP